MRAAIEKAREAGKLGEVPVGAVLVQHGQIIAAAGNRTRSLPDPTAHAEILVLREAARNLGSERLLGCDLYVTLEPCAMCACAISHARIRRLYFGAEDAKMGAVLNGPRIFDQASTHHRPDVYDGIDGSACAELMRDFFLALRQPV